MSRTQGRLTSTRYTEVRLALRKLVCSPEMPAVSAQHAAPNLPGGMSLAQAMAPRAAVVVVFGVESLGSRI